MHTQSSTHSDELHKHTSEHAPESSLDIKQELALIKQRIDRELLKELDIVIEEASREDKLLADVLKHTKKCVLSGGKRLRPALTIYGHLAVSGKLHDLGHPANDQIIRAAAGVEFIHTFLLIHDDIIDRDDYRHGVETIHSKYARHATNFFDGGDGRHFGESVGIIIGDVINCLGNQLLFTTGFDSDRIVRALFKLQTVVRRTGIGEFQDVVMGYVGKASEQNVLDMYESKTARYTFEGPLHIGAILAGLPDEVCDAMSRFSIPLGIAFQIQDDIIGIYGEQEKIGKPTGSDITEGKMTLLMITALKLASPQQKNELLEMHGSESITKSQIERFRELIRETGALEQTNKMMYDYLDTARTELQNSQSLSDVQIHSDFIKFFEALITYLAERKV